MSPEEQAAPITIRAGELPLQAFVSSVMNDELMQARQEVVRAINSFGFAQAWAFEFTPPSSEQVERSYLQKVRTADLVVWISWSSTTAPVRREIEEAVRCNRRIVVLRLAGATPDEETEALVRRSIPNGIRSPSRTSARSSKSPLETRLSGRCAGGRRTRIEGPA